MPPHQSVIPIDGKGSWSGAGIAGVSHKLPGRRGAACLLGLEQNSRMKILTSSRPRWGGEMCTARPGLVGGADVLEVVVHSGMESEHGLAHVVLVASGTLDGIDEVV